MRVTGLPGPKLTIMIHSAILIQGRKSCMLTRILYFFLPGILAVLNACVSGTPSVKIGEGDIGGVVTGPKGPEAGVWVIA